MTRYIAFFFISVLSTLTFAHHSISKPLMDSKAVLQDYSRFEDALNQGVYSLDIAKFLHEFVAADAQFKLQILNAQNNQTDNIGIDKAAYINSFLHGRKMLENYSAKISDIEVVSQNPQKVVIKHRMTETGMAKTPSKTLQSFTSITDCAFNHTLENDTFVVSGGECSTQVALNEDI